MTPGPAETWSGPIKTDFQGRLSARIAGLLGLAKPEGVSWPGEVSCETWGSGYDPVFYYSFHLLPLLCCSLFVFRTTKTHVIVHLYPKFPS